MPRLTIVDGPNGAGKSTLTRTAALRRADDYIVKRPDFVQESTSSASSARSLIAKAKAAGYEVDLRYVGLPASEVSQARVAERIASGGHTISVEDSDRRYGRSMAALLAVLIMVDTGTRFDNGGDQQHSVVAEVSGGFAVFRAQECPQMTLDHTRFTQRRNVFAAQPQYLHQHSLTMLPQ